MKPADYRPFLPEVHDYVDGRLDADARHDFEARLASNVGLRRDVEDLRRTLAALKGLPRHEPAEGFHERVMGRIRDQELAERARIRILPARTPLWQSVVQVATGAVAAAVVLALVGLPGYFGGSGDEESVAMETGAEPSEEDLLPVLGDHFARLESLKRNVTHTDLADPDLQRHLLRLELEHSGLARRAGWLAGEVARLPHDRRAEYAEFMGGLQEALDLIDQELVGSSRERRPVDIARVRGALAEIHAPVALVEDFRIEVRASLPESRAMPISSAVPQEIRLYAEIRRADYRHDPAAMRKAAREYLSHFPSGHLAFQARAAKVAAMIRMGEDELAARVFNDAFGEYDEDLTLEQRKALDGIFAENDRSRLLAAREALR